MLRSIPPILLIPIVLVVALTLGVVWISETNYAEFQRGMSRLVEERTRIDLVNDMALVLLNAETAQRGYLLTGRDEYLRPLDYAKEQLPKLENRLAASLAQPSGSMGRPRPRPAVADAQAGRARNVDPDLQAGRQDEGARDGRQRRRPRADGCGARDDHQPLVAHEYRARDEPQRVASRSRVLALRHPRRWRAVVLPADRRVPAAFARHAATRRASRTWSIRKMRDWVAKSPSARTS